MAVPCMISHPLLCGMLPRPQAPSKDAKRWSYRRPRNRDNFVVLLLQVPDECLWGHGLPLEVPTWMRALTSGVHMEATCVPLEQVPAIIFVVRWRVVNTPISQQLQKMYQALWYSMW